MNSELIKKVCVLIGCSLISLGCPKKEEKITPTVQTYTLNVSVYPPNSGSIVISPQKTLYTSGETVTLLAVPATGYAFTGWSGDASGSANPLVISMNSNKTIVANFTQTSTGGSGTGGSTTNYYTLTVVVNPADSGNILLSPSSNDRKYLAGTQVTLIAQANSGFVFSNWSGDLTGTNNPATIIMNSDKIVIANFTSSQTGGGGGSGTGGGTTVYYTLTVTITPQGAGTVNMTPPGGSYIAGTNVILSATPSSGYIFSRWEGSITTSSNPVVVVMDGNKSITAVFVPSGGTGLIKEVYVDRGAAGFLGAFWSENPLATISLETDTTDAKEGIASMKTTVNVPTGGWAGWWVEEGGIGGNEVADMSSYQNGHLMFWVKSPIVLEVSIGSINLDPATHRAKIMLSGTSAYGFSPDNQWHQVVIPLSEFKRREPQLDFTRITTYFAIAVVGDTQGQKVFWIDDVKWVSP